MKNIPKKDLFVVPEAYFDSLPDKIIQKKARRNRQVYISGIAAAAIVIIGFALLIFTPDSNIDQQYQANINEEVELFIQTGIWGDEEILLLADNPNEILDQILEEEWSYDLEEEDMWEDEMIF